VTIGGKPADFSYIGVTPGSAGLYQLNVTVPAGLTAGNNAVIVTINGGDLASGGVRDGGAVAAFQDSRQAQALSCR